MRKEAEQWRQDKAKAYKEYIHTSAVGLEVGLSIVAGIAIGYLIERYWHIAPWGIVGGFILGSAAACRRLYLFSKKYLKEHDHGGDS